MFFPRRRPWPSFVAQRQEHVPMPRNIAQFTGLFVTTIIVMGTDMDVFYAMPLGIMAGTLASYFVALSDMRAKEARF
jgi:hypothetical protein